MSDHPFETTTIERDGIKYHVALYADYDSTPTDADCYSPSDVEAYNRGDWQYVGVVLTPDLPGIAGADLHDSLWAVEYGDMPAETEPFQGGQHEAWHVGMDEIVNTHPVPDMIAEVRANMRKLRDTLSALDLT